MSGYKALYRKWRPQVFDDVVGQEHIVETLKNEVQTGRFAHAYLFTGSRGTGKTTCSKILAKAVNCLRPVEGNPCLECESCRGIEDGSILDVIEIDAASNSGVENIRQLREESAYVPASCKYRVYIIDETHMLSSGAFNALLKIMEEPPPHVLFILATTEVHKVLPTILSRCQRFDFVRIPPDAIADRLERIAREEGFPLEADAARLIARLADGGLRDAISLLDQCRAGHPEVTLDVVAECAGVAGREHLFELCGLLAEKDAAGLLRLVDRLYAQSKDLEKLCEELVLHFRNIMLAKAMPGDFEKLAFLLPDEAAQLRTQCALFKMSRVLSVLSVLEEALERMHRSPNKRVALEMCLVRLCGEGLEASAPALLERIEKLEAAVRDGAALTAAPVPAPSAEPGMPGRAAAGTAEPDEPAEPARPAAQRGAKPAPSRSFGEGDWAKVLACLKEKAPPVYGMLSASRARAEGDILYVQVDNSFFASFISKEQNQTAMHNIVKLVTGGEYFIRADEGGKQPQAAPEDPLELLQKQAGEAGVPVKEL